MALRVGYQGVSGAYSSIAVAEYFPAAQAIGYPTFDDVVAALKAGDVAYALLPIENSTSGRVADLHHLLPKSGLTIVGEHFLPIHHCLIAHRGTVLRNIRHIYSHREALGQCRAYIRKLRAEPVPFGDTAGAVDHIVAEKNPAYAALASSAAAKRHKTAIVLQKNVEDRADNVTRFLVLTKNRPYTAPHSDVITSIVYATRDVPAALFKSLGGFATAGVNIIKLESFVPMTRHEEASFYVEFEGHPDSDAVHIALDELRYYARKLTILGTYAKSPFRARFETKVDKKRYSRPRSSIR